MASRKTEQNRRRKERKKAKKQAARKRQADTAPQTTASPLQDGRAEALEGSIAEEATGGMEAAVLESITNGVGGIAVGDGEARTALEEEEEEQQPTNALLQVR